MVWQKLAYDIHDPDFSSLFVPLFISSIFPLILFYPSQYVRNIPFWADIDDEEAQRSNTVPIPNDPEPLLALPATNDEVGESIELNRLPTAYLPLLGSSSQGRTIPSNDLD